MTSSARLYSVAAPRTTPGHGEAELDTPFLIPPEGALQFGITRSEFEKNYFEKRWLLRRGALKSIPFGWGDVDELLYRLDTVAPWMKLFHEGEVPSDHYVDVVQEHTARQRLNKAAFYDYLARGATLVLNRLEEHSLAAKRLCAEVSRFAGYPASGNAYLSFGGSGTFGKHWDTHDVFVIQLLGKKRWRVFEPTLPLPLSGQTYESHQSECPREPCLDIELSAGDILYLPRGWWHQAIPIEGGSFHLSVGTYPPTTAEYLHWACETYCSSRADLRPSAGRTEGATLAQSIAELGKIVADPNTLAAYRNSLLLRERTRSEFNLGFLLDSQRSELDADVRVILNSCYLHADNVDAILSADSLSTNGRSLKLHALSKCLIRALAGVGVTNMHALFAVLPTYPRKSICQALLDLARHDVVNVWRDRVLP